MATHSSIFTWEIPWTEEPGGLQSMGSQELDTTERLNRHTLQRTHHLTMLPLVGREIDPSLGHRMQQGMVCRLGDATLKQAPWDTGK